MNNVVKKLTDAVSDTPLRCRPLVFLLAVFLCALLFIQISIILFIIYAALLCLYAAFSGMLKSGIKFSKNPMPAFLAIVLIFGVLLSLPAAISYNKIQKMQGERTVKAVVEHTYYEEKYGSLYLARLESIDGKNASGYGVIRFYADVGIDEYDTVVVRGKVSDSLENLSFGEQLNAKSKRHYVNIDTDELVSVSYESRSGFSYNVYMLNKAIGDRLDKLLPQSTAGFAKAVLLGDKGGLDVGLKSGMSALGISHILAVSGMHMSIIALFITVIANKSRVSRKARSLAIIIGAVLFSAVAAFSPSVVRAAVMLCVGMLGVFVRGRSDSLTSLFLAGALICVFDPQAVLSCSFLLSFSATLGIVLCALYAQKNARSKLYASRVGDMKLWHKPIRAIAFSALVSLSATLFTAPIMAIYFSKISFVSVITNLISFPLAFISMLLTLLTLVLGEIFVIGAWIRTAFVLIYTAFEKAIDFLFRTFDTEISLEYPFLIPCVILLICAIIFMLIRRIRNPMALLGAFIATAILYSGCVQIYAAVNSDRCEVVYLAEKNSEGFVLTYGTKTMLIDIGNGSKSILDESIDIARREYFETGIDAYMLTHYHSDHIGTLYQVLKRTKIKTLYLPIPMTESETEFCKLIKKEANECNVVMYQRGDAVTFGKMQISTVPFSMIERSTHPVIALNFSRGKRSITYVTPSVSESSVCFETEKFILGSAAIICGAHGPVSKENDAFLSFTPDKTVYVSPYDGIEEASVFPFGKYVGIPKDSDGVAILRLAL